MIRRILKTIAEQIAYKTKDVSTLLAFVIIIVYTKNMIETDNSPALFLIAVSIFFYFPLLLIVIYLLLLIPKLVCILILEVIKMRTQDDSSFNYDNDYDDNKEYKWENQQSYDWWKEQHRNYQEQRDNTNYDNYNKQNHQNHNDRQQNNTTRRKDELSEALSFYGLKIPFTESELKDKRRKLMKTAHPDEGGDTETAANINRYYDILKKYTS